MKCWECCWAGISKEEGILIIWVTSQNPFAFLLLWDPLLSCWNLCVTKRACVFVSCQPESAVLGSKLVLCMVHILHLPLEAMAPRWLTSKHYEPSPASQNKRTRSCLSLWTTNSLCLHCGNSSQTVVGGIIFYLMWDWALQCYCG